MRIQDILDDLKEAFKNYRYQLKYAPKFRQEFEDWKKGYEELTDNQLKAALKDAYEQLFFIGSDMKERGVIDYLTADPYSMARNEGVDMFESRINALVSVARERLAARGMAPKQVERGKYIDFTDVEKNRESGLGYHGEGSKGNPKLPKMETELLGCALAFGVDGMKTFAKWRDGIEYGRNVQPHAWFHVTYYDHHNAAVALQKRLGFLFQLEIDPPSYYKEFFDPQGKRQEANLVYEPDHNVALTQQKGKGPSGHNQLHDQEQVVPQDEKREASLVYDASHATSEQFKSLSSDDIARYLEQSFQNPVVIQFLNAANSMNMMTEQFKSIGHYISVYAMATGDLSQESVTKIVQGFKDHPANYRDKDLDLKEILGPMILKYHCQKLGIPYPASIEDTPKLLESVRTQSGENRFETHSFNGALLDEIKTHGLDISREKFQEEFKVLERVGLRQSYEKGSLLFCELSDGTFGYALRSPERLAMSMNQNGNPWCTQGKTQSNRDVCIQMLEQFLLSSKASEADKDVARQAGQKIIDFYFKPSGNKAAIAVRKCNYRGHSSSSFDEALWRQFSYLGVKGSVDSFCRKHGDPQNIKLFDEAQREFNERKKSDKLRSFVREFNKKYPEKNPIQEVYQEFLFKSLMDSLNNYHTATWWGMAIPGGRLSPQDFSLAVLDNPIDNYVAYQKQLLQSSKKKKREAIVPDSLKVKSSDQTSTHQDLQDFMLAAVNDGQGQNAGATIDKHNDISRHSIGGKGRKSECSVPNCPSEPQR